MKPAAFEYHAPRSVEEALALLADLGDDAKVLAGGQSLVPMLSMRLAVFGHLVDITRVEGLSGVRIGASKVSLGATTVDSILERHAGLADTVPLLGRVTPLIGHLQIRNRGTVGGSLAHADPAAEYPAVALALDAEMTLLSARGARRIAAADFFEGLWSTALGPEELLAEVTFPVWAGRCGFGVAEFARRHGDFAIAGAAVAVQVDDADRVARSAVALFGLGPTPLRSVAVEKDVEGRPSGECEPAEVGALAVSDLSDVTSDVQGTAAYRKRVGAAMVAKAWEAARREAEDAGRA